MDALLTKLEQKGILSRKEAEDLKAESAADSAGPRFVMPDWITSYRLSGDFRGRFDQQSGDIATFNGSEDNIRFRYRLRIGSVIEMKDGLEVGFRLGTGDPVGTTGGNPLSNNSTLRANASKKFIYVDTAYGKWTAINDGTWFFSTTIGKMDNPFQTSAMLFDPDYTPEGLAVKAGYKINEHQDIAFNGGLFVLDQMDTSGPFLYGAQALWNAKWSPRIATSFSLAGYGIGNDANLNTNYDSNLGNTLVGGRYAEHFTPIVAGGSFTYKLDSFPLYRGAFPIKLAGEFMDNPGASSDNIGWNAGVTFGKAGKQGTWEIAYRYQYLEADAWWDQIVDDDNAAVFPTSPTTGALAGGTNIQGHLVKASYSITDSLTFTFAAYINNLVDNPVPGAETGAIHAMADLMWKF